MELDQLRYLRAIVQSGSVTAAAANEHVSQPSISKQIGQLERELGAPLFHRVGRRVVPTEAAIELAECAARVFDDLASTVSGIAGQGAAQGGSVRLCATETIANHLLPTALAQLQREQPYARVRVEMLGTDDAIEQVLRDEVDFAMVPLPVADSRLEVTAITEEDVLLAMPRNHAWAGRATVALREVLASPELLLSMPGHGLRAQLDEAARELGIAPAGRIELRSQQGLLAMVAAGGGIALAPNISVSGREDVVARPFSPPLRRSLGWVRRKGRHVSPAGLRLIELVGLAATRAVAAGA